MLTESRPPGLRPGEGYPSLFNKERAKKLQWDDLGWERRGWDSNPRYRKRYTGFRDRLLQPLGHLSLKRLLARSNIAKAEAVCKKCLPDLLLWIVWPRASPFPDMESVPEGVKCTITL